jgi:pantoate--beta-alanine ligase
VRIICGLDEWRSTRELIEGSTLGLVPTMGALHEGHLALIRQSASDNDLTAVSVFVNAPQFDDPNDLRAYPRDLEKDGRLAAAAGDDYLVAPDHEAIYADGYRYRVTEDRLSRLMEGEQRPGHFDGVLTVVLKLLNLVRPRRAYFGEKDYQQFMLVTGMVEALLLPVRIVGCPTVRDTDGLALSSRNSRLSPAARQRAALFPKLLASDEAPGRVRERLQQAGFEVEYVEETHGRRFGAVRLDGVRLIDNFPLNEARS